jgi:hypothetical protein
MAESGAGGLSDDAPETVRTPNRSHPSTTHFCYSSFQSKQLFTCHAGGKNLRIGKRATEERIKKRSKQRLEKRRQGKPAENHSY